jgi:hypothetical protein
VDAFSVFQEVSLRGEEARVNNVVDFGPNIGYLKVRAWGVGGAAAAAAAAVTLRL